MPVDTLDLNKKIRKVMKDKNITIKELSSILSPLWDSKKDATEKYIKELAFKLREISSEKDKHKYEGNWEELKRDEFHGERIHKIILSIPITRETPEESEILDLLNTLNPSLFQYE